MPISSIWRRIEVGAGRYTPGVYRSGNLVVPHVDRGPDLPLELAGLLPNRDHNGDLMQAVERMPRCLTGERPIFGILASDPFLRIDLMADRLAHKGYSCITNLPSAAQYGNEYLRVLNDLDLGSGRERRILTEFKKRGFGISTTIATEADTQASLNLEPEQLFVAPSFDIWSDQHSASDRLLELCQSIADQRDRLIPTTPVVLIVGRLPISLTQAKDTGAQAILPD